MVTLSHDDRVMKAGVDDRMCSPYVLDAAGRILFDCLTCLIYLSCFIGLHITRTLQTTPTPSHRVCSTTAQSKSIKLTNCIN